MEKFRVLVVDDEQDLADEIVTFIDKIDAEYEIKATPCYIFEEALNLLEERRFDLIMLDVRLDGDSFERDDEAGVKILEEIKTRQFIPVIFYTAIPRQVEHLDNIPMIQVLTKEASFRNSGITEAIMTVIDSIFPKINRSLSSLIDEVQRNYLWESADYYPLSDSDSALSLFYTVARRLAISLSENNIGVFASRAVGIDENDNQFDEKVPAERYYIRPPIENTPTMAGDIHSTDENEFVIVLTPSCDFAQNKAEKALIAGCKNIEKFKDFAAWRDADEISNKKKGNLERLLKGRPTKPSQTDRFFYLPSAFDLPHLLVDFQDLYTVEVKELENWKREASLDSPYSEAVVAQFTRYFGRLGTPDLNIDLIISQLEKEFRSSE